VRLIISANPSSSITCWGKSHQAFEKIQREDERQKEAEFRAKMEQQMIATERLASLGTLAAGVAHEINNPLAIIKESAGWMGAILKKDEMANIPRKSDLLKGLEKIESGVERARRITHQLLGSVKQMDSVISEVDLKELLKETVSLVKKEAGNKDIDIVADFDPETPLIWSDPYKLRQIFINLLTNAVHATKGGDKITIGLIPLENQVAVSVQDTGEGIPKENLCKIFDPFFSTKPPGEGTGLGLFVSRSIVQKLGGEMTVESQLGQGTRFLIKLPRIQNAPRDSTGEEPPRTSNDTFETC
jgi:two-component system NtrC family sensor kinase